MNIKELMESSAFIVARNVDEHVIAASVKWDNDLSKLSLNYYLDRPPDEDDEGRCELALTELIAEFVEIKLAATSCNYLWDKNSISQMDGLVYRRGSP